jgi:hypothetical protein
MAQVRTQPLPPGRYWLDVQSAQLDPFRSWVASNPGAVTIEHSEAAPSLTFFIFRTSKPMRFDQRSFGFPSVAGPEINTANDTVQRPPVPTVKSEVIDPLVDAVQSGAASGLGRALIIGALVWAFSKADP